MIGQRVLFRMDDGTLIDGGVITGWTDGRDGLQFTTERYLDLESFASKLSELHDLGMGIAEYF